LGRTQTLIGEFDTAIAELQTAVELNPNLAIAHYGLAFALTYGGEPEQAIPIFDTAIRLSPHDPAIWTFYGFRGLAYFLLQDYEAAIMNFQRAIRHPRTQPWPYAWLASALAQLDRFEEARAALKKLLKMRPDYTPAVQLASASPLDPKAMVPLFQPWIDGLRKAGLDIADEPADAE
jgi:tetratricopeptide (TPR) repeat protein